MAPLDDAEKPKDDSVTLAMNDPAEVLVSDDLEGALQTVAASYFDIFRQWVFLGWTAFGGPSAHIGVFRKVFVEKLRWMQEATFMELLALGSCLPGPTSTQLSFAIGVTKQGWSGGLLSGALFQFPGALILTLVGVGAARFLQDPAGWLRGAIAGLAAVGVSLVLSASLSLTQGICKKLDQQLIAVVAATVTYYYQSAWIFPLLILLGGLATIVTRRSEGVPDGQDEVHPALGSTTRYRIAGLALVFTWVAVLIATSVSVKYIAYDDNKPLHWFTGFYRTGSFNLWRRAGAAADASQLAVRPRLRRHQRHQQRHHRLRECRECHAHGSRLSWGPTALCGTSWLTKDEFFTGLAVSQAMPGPLFNFAAYLGAVIAKQAGVLSIWGALLAWLGIFAPGIMMIYAVLPWWGVFRKWPLYRRALPGLNASAIGLLIAAAIELVFQARQASPAPKTSICIGIIGWGLTENLKVPVPLAIVAGGVLGIIGFYVGLH